MGVLLWTQAVARYPELVQQLQQEKSDAPMEHTKAALRILELEEELKATRDKTTTGFSFLKSLFMAEGDA